MRNMINDGNQTDTYVFFYGGVFSNWYPCRYNNIKYKGITFFNSEQAFMWEKAIYFGDMETAAKIVKTPNPKENKALGRLVKGFDASKWAEVSFDIMVDVNYAKFSQNFGLRNILTGTEDKILVEASPHDTIWGIGIGIDNYDCYDESKWKGQNLLGKALMKVREKLNDER